MSTKRKTRAVQTVSRQLVRTMIRDTVNSKAEHKYYTFSAVAAAAATNTGTVYNLTRDLVQGDNIEQRSGNKVSPLEAQLRFSINLPVAALAGVLRAIWVADTQNTGTLPTVAEILDSASVTSFMSLTSVSNSRFQVLHDACYSMVAGGSNQHLTPIWTHRKKTSIFYNGTTAVNTANGRNSQFLLLITDLAANAPQCTVDYALHYTDM